MKALRKYQREVQRDEISLRAAPKHDWTSHYADGFRYLAIAWREEGGEAAQPKARPHVWDANLFEDDDEGESWKVA